MKILKLVVAPVLFAFMLPSCAGAPAMDAADIEAICVITGEDATGGPTAEFMGKTVNFCCDRCVSKWNKMEDNAKKEAVAKLTR